MKLKIEYININDIKPYKRNAKLHPAEQIEQIKKSIQEFDNCDPIGIWHDEIVEGHGRFIALKELGKTEIPVIRLDHLTDEQRKAYALVHNKLTINSGFDLELLDIELDSIESLDMSDFGFDHEEPETIETQKADPEEDDLFSDIEKMETHYGVPYQGNKSRIADIIISILPKGRRLVDLFGGGWCNHALCLAFREMGELSVQ